jgi:hypothetical protein
MFDLLSTHFVGNIYVEAILSGLLENGGIHILYVFDCLVRKFSFLIIHFFLLCHFSSVVKRLCTAKNSISCGFAAAFCKHLYTI